MKQSDSTNSLTELSEVIPVLECFICLESSEPLVDNTLLRTCGCKFIVHPECWAIWIKNKDEWDCPICRRESLVAGIPQTRNIIITHTRNANALYYYMLTAVIVTIIIIVIVLEQR